MGENVAPENKVKGSVLIVEDERIVAMSLERSIREMGYSVSAIADTGSAAIQAVESKKPNLVLMDIILKGPMSGIEVAGIIQQRYGIPVVYLTAHTDDDTLHRATATGPYGYLVKPIEDGELKSVLEIAVFKSDLEQQLRASEETFRELFRQNFDAIVLFRLEDFMVTDVNPAALQLFGFDRNQLCSNFPAVFETQKLYEIFKQEVTQFQAAVGEVFLDRCRLKKVDGTEIICTIKANVIKLHEKAVVYCTFHDITEAMRIEGESRDLQLKLVQANKMTSLGTLASGVAHEINNPNNYIMANTQIIQQIWEDAVKLLREQNRDLGNFQLGGLDFSEVAEIMPQLLKASLDGSRRIKTITDNLKEYSRPKEVFGWVSINSVLDFAHAMLLGEIKKYTDTFVFNSGSNIPEFKGDAHQWEQVMINLIQNALQSLPHRSNEVYVATFYDKERHFIRVTVADKGIGMNRTLIDRVTEPFFTTKQESGGTGLGLYVSYSIIKKYNGTLEFDSLPGKGTTVTVKIPLNSDFKINDQDNDHDHETHAGARP